MDVILLDINRLFHLICVVIGMGAGNYLELRSFVKRQSAIEKSDLWEVEFIHSVVLIALSGLWITGLLLIYTKTGFEVSNFTPKLWMKLIIVSLLSANAFIIGWYIIPKLKASHGRALVSLPNGAKVCMAFCMSNSLFFWFSALVLGCSKYLKPQPWEILNSIFGIGSLIIICASMVLATFLIKEPITVKQPTV